jgi:hypothetical protein
MKNKFLKFALPVGMGLTLTVISIIALGSSVLVSSCDLVEHCKAGYPLYCSEVGQCCPAGYPYYCDGSCKTAPCPSGSVTVDSCIPE